MKQDIRRASHHRATRATPKETTSTQNDTRTLFAPLSGSAGNPPFDAGLVELGPGLTDVCVADPGVRKISVCAPIKQSVRRQTAACVNSKQKMHHPKSPISHCTPATSVPRLNQTR
jgi:hypothetical protein